MPYGTANRWPPPPPPPPPPPALAAPLAAGVQPLNQRVRTFNDFLIRRQGNKADNIAVDQEMDWRNIGGIPQPLAERRTAADNNQQGVEAPDVAPFRERLAQRIRLRRTPVEAQEVQQRLARAAAAREQTIKEQVKQARIERDFGLPNFVYPGDLQPPAGDILGAVGDNAMAEMQARETAKHRLVNQINKTAVGLRTARLREMARNQVRNDEDRRRQVDEDKLVQALLGGADSPEDLDHYEDLDDRMDFLQEAAGTQYRLGNPNNVKEAERDSLNEPLDNLAAAVRWPRLPVLPTARIPQPAAVLRQQQIRDHEERRIERSQMMARLRRAQKNDEAATARQLAMLRQNNAPAAVAARPAVVDLLSSPEAKKRAGQENLSDPEAGNDSDEEWPIPFKRVKGRRDLAALQEHEAPAAGPARHPFLDAFPTPDMEMEADLASLSDPEGFPGGEDEYDDWF